MLGNKPNARRPGNHNNSLDDAAARCAALWARNERSGSTTARQGDGASSAASKVEFRLLERATNDFDEDQHLLGHGGSCRVFEGEIGGYPVAIKAINEPEDVKR